VLHALPCIHTSYACAHIMQLLTSKPFSSMAIHLSIKHRLVLQGQKYFRCSVSIFITGCHLHSKWLGAGEWVFFCTTVRYIYFSQVCWQQVWVLSLCSFLLFLVPQMASDCLGLLLGFTLLLLSPSCQGLMHLPVNGVGDAVVVWNCDWVLGVKAASSTCLTGDTVVSIDSSVLFQHSPCTACDRCWLYPWIGY